MSTPGRILVVDDERNVRATLTGVLEDEGHQVRAVESGEDALEAVRRESFDVVLLDVWLPGMDGLKVLAEIRAGLAGPPVVMISGHGSIDTAVKATKLGAFDFIEKPLSLDRVLLTIATALQQKRLRDENLRLRAEIHGRIEIVGESDVIRTLRDQVDRAAPSNGRVLIYGENGTGKELVARRIHYLSERSGTTFVEVNCAAIPDDLIESELFGHVKGAFTGAVEDKEGKFSMAHGGTLFLDEIGDMSLKTQAKVLRVLEEQRFEPVGSNRSRTVDARVIAATNKDLVAEIEHGRFRDDLFYRLNVIPITVPALRHRLSDIPLLVDHFFAQLADEYRQPPKRVTEAAIARLTGHRWPGNVRELRNLCERLVIMTGAEEIGEAELVPLFSPGMPGQEIPALAGLTLREARDLFERRVIVAKLREHGGNVSRTAEALDIERSHLYGKMKAFGIDPAEHRARSEEPAPR
jgi:two-component system nitrogen regulation response regulator NtrX